MTRQLLALSMFVVFIGFAADSHAVSTFSQNFESDTLGSAAGWTAGTRNSYVDPFGDLYFNAGGTPGSNRPTIAVINTDSVSPEQSIEVVGVAGGNSMHTWRDYGGLSSNGVDPVTVSFDFKIDSFTHPDNHVSFNPFVFNTALFGAAGTPGPDGGIGWPVEIRVLQTGFVDYAQEGGNVELLPAGTDLIGEWARVTATLKGSQDVDLSITLLTGSDIGDSGIVTAAPFQVSTPADYYDNALDELRGFAFYTRTDQSYGFFNNDFVRIDNFSVTIGVVPEPATSFLFGISAIALLQVARRRRTN